MPPVIIAAVAWAAGAVSIWYVVATAVAYGYQQYQAQKARRQARQAYNASLEDRLVMTTMHDGARSRVYGQVRNVDGIIFKATRGASSEYYTLVIALAGHEVQAIDAVYFNDVEVTLDGSGRVQTYPYIKLDSGHHREEVTVSGGTGTFFIGTGILADSVSVTTVGDVDNPQQSLAFTLSGSNVNISDSSGYSGLAYVQWQEPTSQSFATVKKYLGSPSQDISAEMVARFPALCTSADKFRGIALLLVDLEFSNDAFPLGVPQISAKIRGAKVLDTRTSTTAYTANPALIARDWATYAYGGGLQAAQIDTATFSAAANACEVDLAFTTPLGGTLTQDAYACGIVCQMGSDPEGWLDEIVESMAGRWGFSGGKLRAVAGAWRTPVATITDDWVSDFEDIEIAPTAPRSEIYNALRLTIADAAQSYIQVQAPPVVAAPYVADDGEEFTREITAAGITSVVRAQYVASVMLREGRQSLMLKLPCKHHAWPLELFDNVYVTLPTFGFSAKVFEVLGWDYQHGVGILLTLRESASSVYTIDASYEDLGYSDNTDLPNPWQTEEMAGLALDSGTDQLVLQGDGTLQPRVLVTWDALEREASLKGRIEVRYGNGMLDEEEWQTLTVPGDRTSVYLTNVADREVILCKARSITSLNCAGPWTPQVPHVVLGKSEAPTTPAGLTASAVPGAIRISWTPCPDVDYALTELRQGGSNFDTATRLFRGKASTYDWAWPAQGSYTLRVRHEDTSGNQSNTTNLAITVTDTILVGTPYIDEDAATEVLIASDTDVVSGGLLASVFYTASVDCNVAITVKSQCENASTPVADGDPRLRFGPRVYEEDFATGTMIFDAARTWRVQLRAGEDRTIPMLERATFQLTAGQTVEIGAWFVGEFFPDPNTFYTVDTTWCEVEVIKR